jgi:hypothetical protein
MLTVVSLLVHLYNSRQDKDQEVEYGLVSNCADVLDKELEEE